MTSDELSTQKANCSLQKRTKQFALDVMNFVSSLPRHYTSQVIARQLVRSATSVGANYRAACRARSAADFIAKLKIVEEEADESLYWLELLCEGNIVSFEQVHALKNEAEQILAMTVASIRTKKSQA